MSDNAERCTDVYGTVRGNWICRCMPDEPSSFTKFSRRCVLVREHPGPCVVELPNGKQKTLTRWK